MNPEHLFVGGVAVALGVTALLVSVGNWDACYRFSKIRWVESRGGRAAARCTYAVLGALLVMLGIAIALGFGPNASTRRTDTSATEWLAAWLELPLRRIDRVVG
jgi:hypothetical protein